MPPPTHPVIRPLTADDSAAYRALRKKILEIGDGKYFSDSYTREKQFVTDEQWRKWCTETQEHCTIGTFVDGELVGVMGIVLYGPQKNLTVEWEATWLDPRYRGCGIARQAYEAVYQWTKDHGYKYAVVLIRDENIRSREIREKQGAIYLHTKHNEIWADGVLLTYIILYSPFPPLTPNMPMIMTKRYVALRQPLHSGNTKHQSSGKNYMKSEHRKENRVI